MVLCRIPGTQDYGTRRKVGGKAGGWGGGEPELGKMRVRAICEANAMATLLCTAANAEALRIRIISYTARPQPQLITMRLQLEHTQGMLVLRSIR